MDHSVERGTAESNDSCESSAFASFAPTVLIRFIRADHPHSLHSHEPSSFASFVRIILIRMYSTHSLHSNDSSTIQPMAIRDVLILSQLVIHGLFPADLPLPCDRNLQTPRTNGERSSCSNRLQWPQYIQRRDTNDVKVQK